MTTSIDYPPNLPTVLISVDKNTDVAKYKRNDVQVGPPVYELLSTTGPSLFDCAWSFSAFEFQLFELWYKASIVFGSKSFNMDLIVGAGLESHECFFNSQYSRKRVGKRFRVAAQVLAVAKVYNDDSMLDDLLLLDDNIDGDVSAWVDQFSDLIENVLQPAFPA
jgi:hypothetical protein